MGPGGGSEWGSNVLKQAPVLALVVLAAFTASTAGAADKPDLPGDPFEPPVLDIKPIQDLAAYGPDCNRPQPRHVRHVDLRLAYEPGGDIYIEHGLRGQELDDILCHIDRRPV